MLLAVLLLCCDPCCCEPCCCEPCCCEPCPPLEVFDCYFGGIPGGAIFGPGTDWQKDGYSFEYEWGDWGGYGFGDPNHEHKPRPPHPPGPKPHPVPEPGSLLVWLVVVGTILGSNWYRLIVKGTFSVSWLVSGHVKSRPNL